MTLANIQPEDVDAFNQGVLAGQGAAINGLAFDQSCVDLNAEGPSIGEFATDSVIEGGQLIWSVIKHGFVLSILEGVLLVVNLSHSKPFLTIPKPLYSRKPPPCSNCCSGWA